MFVLKTAKCGFERFIFGFCQENYKTSIAVSYKHEFFVMIIKPEDCASSNNIQHYLKYVPPPISSR